MGSLVSGTAVGAAGVVIGVVVGLEAEVLASEAGLVVGVEVALLASVTAAWRRRSRTSCSLFLVSCDAKT